MLLDSGSSVSHWDKSFTPDELMEPALRGAIHDPGLAPAALEDEGWSLCHPDRLVGVLCSVENLQDMLAGATPCGRRCVSELNEGIAALAKLATDGIAAAGKGKKCRKARKVRRRAGKLDQRIARLIGKGTVARGLAARLGAEMTRLVARAGAAEQRLCASP
jgi:hypothetical protein